AGSPSYSFSAHPNDGLFWVTNGPSLSVGSAETMRWTTTGTQADYFTANHSAMGIGVGPQANNVLYVQNGGGEDLTSSSYRAIFGSFANAPSSASTATVYGASISGGWSGTANSPSGTVYGVFAQASASPGSGGTVGTAEALHARLLQNDVGTVTTAYG